MHLDPHNHRIVKQVRMALEKAAWVNRAKESPN